MIIGSRDPFIIVLLFCYFFMKSPMLHSWHFDTLSKTVLIYLNYHIKRIRPRLSQIAVPPGGFLLAKGSLVLVNFYILDVPTDDVYAPFQVWSGFNVCSNRTECSSPLDVMKDDLQPSMSTNNTFNKRRLEHPKLQNLSIWTIEPK